MTPKILCVDDDRGFCRVVAQALEGEGYRVLLAHDGESGLAAVPREEPDLLLIDVLLPRRDGFALLEAVRGLGTPLAEVPALLLSGCSRAPGYAQRAELLRAFAFLTKPVPLDTLLGLVAKALAGGPPVATTAAGRYRVRGATLRGRLEELPFPELLHQLHGLRASGVLHLRDGRKHKRLELREGRPVAVRSNLVNECLGNLLVRMGRIGQAELGESLRRLRRGEGLQGQILVAMQVLSEEELAQALRVQAEEKLFEIFEWRSGSFALEPGARLQRANALALDRSPGELVLEGVRRRFPLERIDAFLTEQGRRTVVPGASPFYRFQHGTLSEDERELLEQLGEGGPIRTADLLAQPEGLRRSAYALLVTGHLELREPQPGEPVAAWSRPQRAEEEAGVAQAAEGGPPVSENDGAKGASDEAEDREQLLREELAAWLEARRTASPFAVLEVPETADEIEIRRAYARLAKRTHPDRYATASQAVRELAEAAFERVARAYEELLDPVRRAAHRADRHLAEREAAAQEAGRRALEAELAFQRGEGRMRLRDYAGALEAFRQACELYPEEGEYHAHRGWALYLAAGGTPDAWREAAAHVRKGIKLAPEREKPYLFLGRLYQAAGRSDLAERLFMRALLVRPECVEAQRELRLLRKRRRKRRGWWGWLRARPGPREASRWPRGARPGEG